MEMCVITPKKPQCIVQPVGHLPRVPRIVFRHVYDWSVPLSSLVSCSLHVWTEKGLDICFRYHVPVVYHNCTLVRRVEHDRHNHYSVFECLEFTHRNCASMLCHNGWMFNLCCVSLANAQIVKLYI